MPLYLVSYDLRNHATFGQYENLIAAITQLGGSRVQLSEWVVRRNEASVTLRDQLRPFIHAQDRLLVSEITANWASWNIMANINEI
jgi:CRISPR/Cas system-associated endoribonuclease Cas2